MQLKRRKPISIKDYVIIKNINIYIKYSIALSLIDFLRFDLIIILVVQRIFTPNKKIIYY